jgi:hypothetical protein
MFSPKMDLFLYLRRKPRFQAGATPNSVHRSETLVRLSLAISVAMFGLATELYTPVSTVTRCVLATRMQETHLLNVCCQGKVFRT